MLKIRKNSDKLIILLHEIYGINNNIKEIEKILSGNGLEMFHLIEKKRLIYIDATSSVLRTGVSRL